MFKDRPVPNFIAKRMYERHSVKRLVKEINLVNSGIISKGDNLVDIGCGPGHLSIEMAKITGKQGVVTALDIHPLAIKSVEKLMVTNNVNNINTVLTRDLDTGLLDESVDVIFIFNTYDMIRNKNRLHDEIVKILKENGILVICNNRRFITSNRKYKNLFKKYDNMIFDYQKKTAYYYKKSFSKNNNDK